MSDSDIHALIREWEQIAKRKFADAQSEQDPMGRRLIENGAMCYFNCAQALSQVLSASAPRLSATEEVLQT